MDWIPDICPPRADRFEDDIVEMKIYHKNLAENGWNKLTLAEQLANIGSEYFRAVNWKKKKIDKYFQPAFERMLELLILSLSDKRWSLPQLKELARLKECLCWYLFDDEHFQTDKNFDKYFMDFSLLARKGKI